MDEPASGNRPLFAKVGGARHVKVDASQVSVAIVDADRSARHSLRLLLSTFGFQCREFESGHDFLNSTRAFDWVILDSDSHGTGAAEVLRDLASWPDGPAVILVAADGDVRSAVKGMKLGAADYLQKPFPAEQLLGTIKEAIRRRREEGALVAPMEAAERIAALSPRQRDVLEGVIRGDSNKVIAAFLGLSVRTVENHRAEMMVRLGVRNVAEAVRIGLSARSAAARPFPDRSGRRSAALPPSR
jgi:two-component system, LuxR family, response regulator FixJ